MSESVSPIKSRQVRFVGRAESHIRDSAKRYHGPIQAEISYRMDLLSKLGGRSDVVIQ
ncbi:hypothetical protein ACUXKP_001197 [Pantoea piersonii]|jgi:hypothetical protein